MLVGDREIVISDYIVSGRFLTCCIWVKAVCTAAMLFRNDRTSYILMMAAVSCVQVDTTRIALLFLLQSVCFLNINRMPLIHNTSKKIHLVCSYSLHLYLYLACNLLIFCLLICRRHFNNLMWIILISKDVRKFMCISAGTNIYLFKEQYTVGLHFCLSISWR